MKKISLIALLSANILLAAGTPTGREAVLEEIFIGSSFTCNGLTCIAGETRIEDEKTKTIINKSKVDFEFIPKNIIYTDEDIISISKKRCRDRLDLKECIGESIQTEKYERGRKVMSAIKEITVEGLSIINKSDNSELIVERIYLEKKAKRISKNEKVKINIEDLLIDTKINIEGIKLNKKDALILVDKIEKRINNYEDKENRLKVTDGLERKKMNQIKNIYGMYTDILKEFLKTNNMNENLKIIFKTEKRGKDLNIITKIDSDAKNAERIKISFIFNIENINKSLDLYNKFKNAKNPGKEEINPLGSLMILSQNLNFKKLSINGNMTNLVDIHKNLLLNREYKEKYQTILKIQESLNEKNNGLVKYIYNTILLKNNISNIEIKNINDLKLMMILMSLSGDNLEKLLKVTTEYK